MATKLVVVGAIFLLLAVHSSAAAAADADDGESSSPMPEIIEQVVNRLFDTLPFYVDAMPQMPIVHGYSVKNGRPVPKRLDIGMYAIKWKFHSNLSDTTVFAYGKSAAEATFPGPTIEALRGVGTSVTWLNFLPPEHILPWDPTLDVAVARSGVPTVVHLHGGIIAPADDGYAFSWFTYNFTSKGPQWAKPTYSYPNVQGPGTLMYHDHALGLTRENLLAGLIGSYIIRDPFHEDCLNLPKGNDFDRVLMIADRTFRADGSLYMNPTGSWPPAHPQWQPEYYGEVITVNGKAWPYLKVKPRKYRFRIINGSNARYYNLTLSTGLPFNVIGSDGAYLPSPVATQSFVISIAEGFDVVIDFSTSAGKEIELLNHARYPYPDGNDTDGTPLGKVMKFVVQKKSSTPDTSTIPPYLLRYVPAIEAEEVKRRYIAMYENLTDTGVSLGLFINGKKLLDPPTETPKTGSTEVWEVINLTGDNHPLHLHLASFQALRMTEIVDYDTFQTCMQTYYDPITCNVSAHAVGAVTYPPEYERTWKHVVKLSPGQMTTIIVKFLLVEDGSKYPFDATAEPGYFYHCHILDHEDNAMIRPLKLVP